MRIEIVSLTNFLSHSHTTLDLTTSPLWLFAGPNGAGKTAVFESVELALYGEHRLGKRQKLERLLKHGTDQATIEVVFNHQGRRYLVSRKFGRQGNIGGSLFYLEGDQRVTVPNVGVGKTAVWDYVEKHILKHQHFRSSIYLSQGDLAHFFGGGAGDRAGNFALLMDLSQLHGLAAAADGRARKATQTIVDLRVEMNGYNEALKNDALPEADAKVAATDKARKDLDEQRTDMALRTANARRWNLSQARIAEIDTRIAELTTLIAQSADISRAAERVRAWEKVAPALASLWEHRERASEFVRKAEEAERQAAEAESLAHDAETMRTSLAERKAQLEGQLPNLKEQLIAAEKSASRIELEISIAGQVVALAKAKEICEKLKDAPARVKNLEVLERAIFALEEFLAARADLSTQTQALENAKKAVADAKLARDDAKAKKDTADTDRYTADERVRDAENQSTDMASRVKILQDEIAKHEIISADADRCPVCDQPLTTPARKHVSKTIDEKKTEHRNLQTELTGLQKNLTGLRKKRDRAKLNRDEALASWETAKEALSTVQEKRGTIDGLITGAQAQLERAKARVRREAKDFASTLESVTSKQIKALGERLKELLAARREAEKYEKASSARDDAKSQLTALRAQRGNEHGPGDDQTPVTLTRQQSVITNQIQKLQSQQVEIIKQVEDLVGDISAAGRTQASEAARADNERKHGKEFQQQAADEKVEADKARVPEEWQAVAVDRTEYDKYATSIDELRQLAARASELDTAQGELGSHQEERRIELRNSDDIPANHRITAEEAERQKADVDSRWGIADHAYTEAVRLQADLTSKLDAAQNLLQRLAEVERRKVVYMELHRLLTTAVEYRVVRSVQEEIRARANDILRRANDPLEIRLGEPLRANSAEQDLVFVDRQDPAGDEKLYESLSAGEKARIAMAVAVSIHLRASGEPGSLLIDEAFAEIDEQLRHSYAQEISDSSQGWIEKGLVTQVVLATHVSDVFDFFPARCLMRKENGEAKIEVMS